jgi:hypothetical protein
VVAPVGIDDVEGRATYAPDDDESVQPEPRVIMLWRPGLDNVALEELVDVGDPQSTLASEGGVIVRMRSTEVLRAVTNHPNDAVDELTATSS